jgi:hypothetical protein
MLAFDVWCIEAGDCGALFMSSKEMDPVPSEDSVIIGADGCRFGTICGPMIYGAGTAGDGGSYGRICGG